MDTGTEIQVVDIEKVFKEKNPGLYRWIPGFIMSYIKRTLHEDIINNVLRKSKGLYGIDFANLILKEFDIKIKHYGMENIPSSGPVIIAANHPLAGIEGTAMISMVGEMRKDVRFIVNDLLTNLTNFADVFVPVNKLSGNAKSNLEIVEKVYASDVAVMVFPAGLCSRKIDGVIQDLPWQKSFVNKALKYKHPIVPVFVRGRNSDWFYNLSRFRTAIGIKANIEMFYLVDEVVRQRGKTIEFSYGKPIMPEDLSDTHSPKEWTNRIRSFVYNLDKEPELSFADYLKKTENKKMNR